MLRSSSQSILLKSYFISGCGSLRGKVFARISRGIAHEALTRFPIIENSELIALSDIQPFRLRVVRNPNPQAPPPSDSLIFGQTFTDHMLTIPWKSAEGWGEPLICPYGPLVLEPSATVFHYASTIFEGMKAYRDDHGQISLFRPDMNMSRMISSAKRIALPTFGGNALVDLIKSLICIDKHWIPREPGHSLYIRPTLIGTQKAIGVRPPTEAILFVICSPVGPYYSSGFKPQSLYGTVEYVRAVFGGTGQFKIGANYAPGIVPQNEAATKGYSQNLWLYGKEHYLTEVGTMNLFVVLQQENGLMELVTPPLDGMILPGITRDSVLSLARNHISGKRRIADLPSNLCVNERVINMGEVKTACQQGRLLELFGAGTAAVICPIDRIGYMGDDLHIPTGPDGMGTISKAIWNEIIGIQYGKIKSDWSIPVCNA